MVKAKSRRDIFAFQLKIINWHLLNISKWIYTSFPQAFIFVLVASNFQIYPCVVRVNTKLSLKNSFKRGGDTRGEQEVPSGYNHTRGCVETPGQRHRFLGKEESEWMSWRQVKDRLRLSRENREREAKRTGWQIKIQESDHRKERWRAIFNQILKADGIRRKKSELWDQRDAFVPWKGRTLEWGLLDGQNLSLLLLSCFSRVRLCATP